MFNLVYKLTLSIVPCNNVCNLILVPLQDAIRKHSKVNCRSCEKDEKNPVIHVHIFYLTCDLIS